MSRYNPPGVGQILREILLVVAVVMAVCIVVTATGHGDWLVGEVAWTSRTRT